MREKIHVQKSPSKSTLTVNEMLLLNTHFFGFLVNTEKRENVKTLSFFFFFLFKYGCFPIVENNNHYTSTKTRGRTLLSIQKQRKKTCVRIIQLTFPSQDATFRYIL